MFFWHVPAPNEALLISGSKRHNEATQFRIVTGHGCFVTPAPGPMTAATSTPSIEAD